MLKQPCQILRVIVGDRDATSLLGRNREESVFGANGLTVFAVAALPSDFNGQPLESQVSGELIRNTVESLAMVGRRGCSGDVIGAGNDLTDGT